jgi:hypothetical protein
MLFMNEWDIEEAVNRFRQHPTLGPAARFLRDFKNEVNSHSDGWPYWSPPVHACKQLIQLFPSNPYQPVSKEVTRKDVLKALAPIKSFMTRRGNKAGMKLPDIIWEQQMEFRL